MAVPAAIDRSDPKSGVGRMWRNVLAGLAERAEVRFTEPGGALPRRDAPDLWLSDCGLGAIPVDGPLVVQVHEAGWDDDEVRALLDPQFVEVVLEGWVGDAVRAASHIVTPSVSARDQVIRHWGVARERVHAVHHGVDATLFHPDRDRGPSLVVQAGGRPGVPYVLFVSQIHPRKNLGTLREAMAGLARRGFPHQLVVVGAAAQDRVDSQAFDEEAGADLPHPGGSVVRLREIEDDDLADLMAGAEVFCLPSLMEGFGMTVLEAMSCGTPVVVSDRGSLPEVVGDVGVVVPPTTEAVTDALAALVSEPTRAERLGRAGRERALDFTWDRTAAGWLEVVQLALDDERGGRRRFRRGRAG